MVRMQIGLYSCTKYLKKWWNVSDINKEFQLVFHVDWWPWPLNSLGLSPNQHLCTWLPRCGTQPPHFPAHEPNMVVHSIYLVHGYPKISAHALGHKLVQMCYLVKNSPPCCNGFQNLWGFCLQEY